jgi:hypothetical protein
LYVLSFSFLNLFLSAKYPEVLAASRV